MKQVLHIVHWKMSGIFGVAKNLKQQGATNGDIHKIVLLRHDKSFVDKLLSYCRILKLTMMIFSKNNYIVHCHSFLPLLIAYIACAKHITFTIHNTYPFFYEKSMRSGLKKWLMRRMLENRCIKVSSVSNLVAESARKGALIESHVIYNGLDISEYPFQSTTRTIRTIGTAGRLDEQKNYCALIDAFSMIETADKILLIAGDGVQQNKLKNKIIDSNLAASVKLVGYQEDIKEFMNHIDGFVCSSLYEGLNLVVIEAMLLGKPVISTNVGVAADVKELIFPRMGFEPAEMASSIGEWFNTPPEILQEQVRLNRDIAVRCFDISRIYDEYCNYLWAD